MGLVLNRLLRFVGYSFALDPPPPVSRAKGIASAYRFGWTPRFGEARKRFLRLRPPLNATDCAPRLMT